MANLQKVLCRICTAPIWRARGRINENKKFRHNFYCSTACMVTAQRKSTRFQCENERCGQMFERRPSAISPHNFCSGSCAAIVNNQKFPKWKIGPRQCARSGCVNIVKGELKYCSASCRKGVRRRFTTEGLIQHIQKKVRVLGRTPGKREMPDIADACVHYFGSWNNAIIAAGLIPNRSDNQRMYHRTRTTAKDGHKCDSVSEAIIDNWLTDRHITHTRDVAYPATHHKADWKIGVAFVEYFGLAEDSPRYDRAVKKKRGLCKKHKIPLIELYPQDLYPALMLDRKLKNMISRL